MDRLKSLGKVLAAMLLGTFIVLIIIGAGAILAVVGTIIGVILLIGFVSMVIWYGLTEDKHKPPSRKP